MIAYMVFTGVSRASGQTYSGPCAELFRFANGKITEWRPMRYPGRRGDRRSQLIPTCIDYDAPAHLRRPMVMMCQG